MSMQSLPKVAEKIKLVREGDVLIARLITKDSGPRERLKHWVPGSLPSVFSTRPRAQLGQGLHHSYV